MRDTDIESYIRTRLGRANPIGRGEDVILPLLPAQKDRRASVREQVTSLFTDYGHGAAEREQGIPTPPRALSVAERLVAFQDFHAAVLSQKFRSSIGGIVRSHTRGVPSEAVEHSPLILRRSPLLESDLIRGYSLQGEKKTA